MEVSDSRCWNPGFVVMRWRHLFWLLPLLGLVTGVAWTWMEEFEEVSVSGLMENRDDVAIGKSGQSNEKLMTEGIALLTSDRVLEVASTRLNPKPWWVNASVASLHSRQRVEMDPVQRSPVIRMTVRGRGKKATGDAWMAIYEAAESITRQIIAENERTREAAELDAANGKVLRFENELAALKQSPATPGSTSGSDVGTGDAKVAELAAARREQRSAQMNLECGLLMSSGGIALISPPDTPPILPARFGPAGMLGFHGALGLGVGAVLAMCLAYGMEVVRPYRRIVADRGGC